MELITSTSNVKVKYAVSLQDKKVRRQCRRFIAEGVTAVLDIPQRVIVCCYYVSESAYKLPKVAAFLSRVTVPVYYLTDRVFAACSDTVTPSGLMAVVEMPAEEKQPTGTRILLLDGVSDAGNMGTLIRTAVAFGYQTVIGVNCVDFYSGKVVRSTMSGLFKLKLMTVGAEEAARMIIDGGYTSVAMDMHGVPIDKAGSFNKICLLLGSEAHGVTSPALKQCVTQTVAIPMCGDIESLNVAVAGGIGMYMLSR